MIKLIKEGIYHLKETKDQTKILSLDHQTFAWVNAAAIGEILVTTHKSHETDTILSIGEYKLYKVKDEPKLTDLEHLELSVGEGKWQGYLLPTGLPDNQDIRNRIIPTEQLINQ